MPKVKLTDAAVQKLSAPSGGRVEYFDVTLPGFGLRVAGPTPRNPDGRRSWVLFYRHGGEQKRLTLEPGYPAMGLAAARKRAGEALGMLADGKDPGLEKARAKAEAARRPDTIANVVDEFVRRNLEGKRRAHRYIQETRRNFRNHVLSRWGERDIKAITRRDVIELLDAIGDHGSDVRGENGERKHVPGGPICANRTLAAVRALFNWALRRGIIDSTPVALVERPGEETRRERTLSADELRAIWPQAQKLGAPAGPFFLTLMLLGQRREETAGMRWADLDLKEATWTIPAEMTKAGRGHVVPLPAVAIEVLSVLPRKTSRTPAGALQPSPYVFTLGGASPISGYSALKKRLDAAVTKSRMQAGLAALAPWTVHDLRRTAATEMARLGVSRFIIGRILNHADRSITGIYDRHSYLAEKRQALDLWAREMESLTKPTPDNVAQFRRAAE
jgi:integrase